MNNQNFRRWINQAAQIVSLFKFDYSDMITSNGGRPLINPIILLVNSLGFRISSPMTSTIYCFIRQIHDISSKQGLNGCVLFLNACHLSLMQSVSGYNPGPEKTRISSTGCGLPRVIPIAHSNSIRQNDKNILQLWLSLFSLYRVLSFTGQLNLETIYADSSFSKRNIEQQHSIVGTLTSETFVEWFYNQFNMVHGFISRGELGFAHSIKLGPVLPIAISKSAPGTSGSLVSTSSSVLSWQAHALINTNVLPYLETYLKGFETGERMLVYLYNMSAYGLNAAPSPVEVLPGPVNTSYCITAGVNPGSPSAYYVGNLGLNEEAAGNVSVFAMVDAWTQWALRPLHDYLFSILKPITMDGTFDQLAPLYIINNFNYKSYFSFDLSSATDRLPVYLQSRILRPSIGKSNSVAWANLLTDSWYWLYSKNFDINVNLKYNVGQPMGALSSWAMLAMTHHFIVQRAWWNLGHRHLFRDYAVLGDDIVICNKLVAKEYLRIMDLLGVGINLSKSLISSHAFEFANRFIFNKDDVSPLSFKEINALGENLMSVNTFSESWSISVPSILYLVGGGFHFLGSYRDKSILALGPNFRAAILFLSRDDSDPLSWFSMYSLTNGYIIPIKDQFILIEYIWNLYSGVIDKAVSSKKKIVESVIKIADKEKEFSSSLTYSLFAADVRNWHMELGDIQTWLHYSNPGFMMGDYNDGFNAVVLSLRKNLELVNSCPDFDYVLNSKTDLDLNVKKVTFCQEVAIWLSVASNISGHNYPLVVDAPNLTADSLYENPRFGGSTSLLALIWTELSEQWSPLSFLLAWMGNESNVMKYSEWYALEKEKTPHVHSLSVIKFVNYTNYFDYSYPFSYLDSVSGPTAVSVVIMKYFILIVNFLESFISPVSSIYQLTLANVGSLVPRSPNSEDGLPLLKWFKTLFLNIYLGVPGSNFYLRTVSMDEQPEKVSFVPPLKYWISIKRSRFLSDYFEWISLIVAAVLISLILFMWDPLPGTPSPIGFNEWPNIDEVLQTVAEPMSKFNYEIDNFLFWLLICIFLSPFCLVLWEHYSFGDSISDFISYIYSFLDIHYWNTWLLERTGVTSYYSNVWSEVNPIPENLLPQILITEDVEMVFYNHDNVIGWLPVSYVVSPETAVTIVSAESSMEIINLITTML